MDPRVANFIRHRQKRFWSLVGGRYFTAFGHRLRVDPETELPQTRRYRIPPGPSREHVLRYTDHVQLRGVGAYLDSFAGSPIVVEVGASTGGYACILGSILRQKKGRMIAIEPNPHYCEVLRRNLALNNLESVVTVEQTAIGDFDGSAKFVIKGKRSTLAGESEPGIPVKIATLRTVLKNYHLPRIDLLMIDVEGAELHVLRGFPWGSIPVDQIFCELHPYAWQQFGYMAADLDQFLDFHKLLPIDMFLRPWPKLPDSTHWSSYIGPTLLVPLMAAAKT
jgi:FkbM family methyltransferase